MEFKKRQVSWNKGFGIAKGDKYNRLTAIKFSHRNKWGNSLWLFKCDCGNKKIIRVSFVKSGHIKSCGCLQKENAARVGHGMKIHGMVGSNIYNIWTGMKQRCLNKNNEDYKNYGGRGIIICERWMKFENFYKDMEKRPEGKSLDRIDNNGNYCKENCKWSFPKEQANNTRRNRFIIYGSEVKTISQWARVLKINPDSLRYRLNKGLTLKEIINNFNLNL